MSKLLWNPPNISNNLLVKMSFTKYFENKIEAQFVSAR